MENLKLSPAVQRAINDCLHADDLELIDVNGRIISNKDSQLEELLAYTRVGRLINEDGLFI